MMKLEQLQIALAATLVVSGCESLGHMTKPPSFSPVETGSAMTAGGFDPNDAHRPDHPGAASEEISPTAASLWRSGPESLFGDRRARKIGDIVTVLVEIDDEAEMQNRTGRSRSGSDTIEAPALFGVGALAQRVLPGGAGLNPAVDVSSSAESAGEGSIKREEKITLRVAATIVGLLANGHLVVNGDQEVRVNYEMRELHVSGVIRTEDISRSNVITYDKIADAKISYGGRGQITDMQRARYGQQIVDMISPF